MNAWVSWQTDIYEYVQGNSLNRELGFFFFKKIAASSLKSLKIDGSTAKLHNNSGVEGKVSLCQHTAISKSNW